MHVFHMGQHHYKPQLMSLLSLNHEYQRVPTDDNNIKGAETRTTRPIPLDVIERNNRAAKNQTSFDRLFCKRFFRICQILFSRSNPDGSLIGIWSIFILASLINEIAVYFAGSIPSRFYIILISKDLDGLKTLLVFSMLIVLGAGLGKSVVKFVGGIFSLYTRKILTKHLQSKYVNRNTFYRLLTTRPDIDNPDQRITQDVDKFAETLRLICEEIIIAPILIAYYTYLTWAFSGYLGPVLVYSYFLFGIVGSRFLIVPLVNLVFMKEFHEGNFSLGENAEYDRLNSFFTKILNFTSKIIERELCLQAFTESISYFGSILSYIILAILIFNGNSFITMYLIYKFTEIVDQSVQVSDLAGYTARIGQLLEAIEDVDNELENVEIDSPFSGQLSGELIITFDQISITTPSGHQLLSDFKFFIEQEKNLMIVGPNGSGKTSLLRVMCGLWPVSKGHIIIPHTNDQRKLFVYLPQTPYLAFGSLRDQITYPMRNDETTKYATDEEVRTVLAMVNLTHLEQLLFSFDAHYGIDWDKMLTPGEQQKLAFARLFFWRPVFAALDESTSMLDSFIESQIFESCKDLGITTITVSHNKNLLKYHDKVLLLDGKGGYSTSDIDINGCEDVWRWIDGNLRI
ncbi:ABC transporter transmembrane region 2-domain-containing protein [Gigaspora rosea]|uniref:ABC transporter transmembrane region 2-domain-containing protein n=1 Tax=Gigaspora rosea TaxID=44941 RepID=A0A397V228_9GLOM|nr:ABC transporter transmembrane region 2-domain-containing protein [Gigaspora rosea]